MSRPITPAEQAELPADYFELYLWSGIIVLALIALAVLFLVVGNRARKGNEHG